MTTPVRGPIIGSLAAGLLGQAVLVVTGVLAARLLGPTDRGYLALLILLPTVLQLAGNIGLPLAVTYYIARDRTQERPIIQAVRLPFLGQVLALSALHAGLLWLIVGHYPTRVHWAALVTLPFLAGALADMYGKAILQGQGRFTAFNLMRNAVVAFYLAGLVIVFASGHSGLIAFTAAWVAANVLSGALALFIALRGSRRRSGIDTQPFTRAKLFRFGLRGYLASLSPVTTFRLDQALIGLFLAPTALGLYVAALAFTHLPEIISRGIGMIALPHVASVRGSTRRPDIRMFFLVTTGITAAVMIVLEIGAEWLVPLFFGEDFEGSVTLARILLVGSFLWGVRRIITDTASGSGRPGLGSIAELASWIVVVPLLAIFMPLWGVVGVAAAMTLSSAVSLLVLVVLVIRADSNSRRAQGSGPPRPRPMMSRWTV